VERLFTTQPLPALTSWFAVALDEIRTIRILREKADCKQPNKPWDFENPTCPHF